MDEYGNKIQKRSTKQKIFRFIAAVFITIFTIILLYIEINVVCSIYEGTKLKSYSYGTEYKVNNHKMVADINGNADKPTIVILTGFGTPSPVLHYKPLSNALSEKYRVITLEPFGYGLSDVVDEERTINNVVTELHKVIEQIGLGKYYLLGHSLGGLYGLYWANLYPNEVLGFIGADTVVTDEINDYRNAEEELTGLIMMDRLGYQRMSSLLDKNNVYIPLYSKYNYTDEEIEMFRILSIKRFMNKSQFNEYSLVDDNMEVAKDMKFPENVRVLNYICSDMRKIRPLWKEHHISVGSNSTSNEVIELPGDHLYFFMDNIEEIITKLDTWIS